ncbi:Uncharacterised protein [Candidatus Venteria ishoeyi]|uniref:Phage major capsid protein E n=1 Tax=Candidatus Venteria ishoeyi TaxID=1899563 RepID=A0A1H6F8Q4_9GAMM|nr:Uncharacterised protein [Candidatus Venteria ishoeyi]
MAPILKADGTSETLEFLPETTKGNAVAYPTGTSDTFALFRGPAQRFSTINRPPMGNGRYQRTEKSKDDKRIEIDTESVWLPMCKRPALTVTLKG